MFFVFKRRNRGVIPFQDWQTCDRCVNGVDRKHTSKFIMKMRRREMFEIYSISLRLRMGSWEDIRQLQVLPKLCDLLFTTMTWKKERLHKHTHAHTHTHTHETKLKDSTDTDGEETRWLFTEGERNEPCSHRGRRESCWTLRQKTAVWPLMSPAETLQC